MMNCQSIFRSIRSTAPRTQPAFLLAAVFLVAPCRAKGYDDGIQSTVQTVRQIVAETCADCHSGDERNGGLALDDPQTFFRQADSGEFPAVRNNVEQSSILQRIRSTDEDLQMPPDGERLSEKQIAAFEQWISSGAADLGMSDDASAEDATESSHWSFQPIRNPTPPIVDDPEWSTNPIDQFIRARHHESNVTPVGIAQPATILRRAAYGLTGLPPSFEEVAKFEARAAATGLDQALSSAVDDYLSRPTYGQRWGRHWMDWVRYADTAGDNSDFPIPQAYLYRNYIIDAFNADVPYDQFLTEQLAGDLMEYDGEEQRQKQIIATGYLGMARRFGSLVERYPWHLTIEDTIDNVGRTMMGLTISCARCHDHKFDPVSTRDYYSLYGIFASTRYPFPGIELFQTQHDLVPLMPENEAKKLLGPYLEKTFKLEKELDRLLAKSRKRAVENADRENRVSLEEKRRDRDELDRLLKTARKAGEKLAEHLKSIPDYPAAYAVQDDQPVDAQVQIKGEPTRPGATVERGFPVILGGQRLPADVAENSSGRLQLAQWITSPDNPLTARVIVNRVWQRHFGAGLVPSTSDFGLRGEKPTHPELLDWLATELVRSGWSIKQLHRTIMTSRVYQLSSIATPDNMEIDPGNRFLWKFNRQRLDAESIRDTLLALSGTLDMTPKNEPFAFPPRTKWKYTQHHPFKDDYPSNKRSVYLMTKRLTAKTYFQTFDGPDRNVCTSDRDESVTPLQALYFVNDELFHEQADLIAQNTAAGASSDDDKVDNAFRLLLSRNPTVEETLLVRDHFIAAKQRAGDDSEAWTSTIRSLMRMNEFLYLD